jgi:hypothetical protein
LLLEHFVEVGDAAAHKVAVAAGVHAYFCAKITQSMSLVTT